MGLYEPTKLRERCVLPYSVGQTLKKISVGSLPYADRDRETFVANQTINVLTIALYRDNKRYVRTAVILLAFDPSKLNTPEVARIRMLLR